MHSDTPMNRVRPRIPKDTPTPRLTLVPGGLMQYDSVLPHYERLLLYYTRWGKKCTENKLWRLHNINRGNLLCSSRGVCRGVSAVSGNSPWAEHLIGYAHAVYKHVHTLNRRAFSGHRAISFEPLGMACYGIPSRSRGMAIKSQAQSFFFSGIPEQCARPCSKHTQYVFFVKLFVPSL